MRAETMVSGLHFLINRVKSVVTTVDWTSLEHRL